MSNWKFYIGLAFCMDEYVISSWFVFTDNFCYSFFIEIISVILDCRTSKIILDSLDVSNPGMNIIHQIFPHNYCIGKSIYRTIECKSFYFILFYIFSQGNKNRQFTTSDCILLHLFCFYKSVKKISMFY